MGITELQFRSFDTGAIHEAQRGVEIFRESIVSKLTPKSFAVR